MTDRSRETVFSPLTSFAFRAALLFAAATLAFYIPFKYATQLHAISGIYAVVFPLSGLLALAGIVLAIKPGAACDCSAIARTGFGLLASVWLATGLLCTPSLVELTRTQPAGGAIAVVHMSLQHIVLSLAVLGFALAPERMSRIFGDRHLPGHLLGQKLSPTG